MSTLSPFLDLVRMSAADIDKAAILRDTLRDLEVMTQTVVESATLLTPPDPTTVPGKMYLVPSGSTGAWVGQTDSIAYSDGANWVFYAPLSSGVRGPKAGWSIWVRDTRIRLYSVRGTEFASNNTHVAHGATSSHHILNIGFPTGSAGLTTGDINVGDRVYQGVGVAIVLYNHPDYVFEKYFTGRIEKFKDNPGAAEYEGMLSFKALRKRLKTHYKLPGAVSKPMGLEARQDLLLRYVEELFLYLIHLNKQLDTLENASEG